MGVRTTYLPPYIRISRKASFRPPPGIPSARNFLLDLYAQLDAYHPEDGGAAAEAYGNAFAADGSFVIAGFPPSIGPAAVTGAVDAFFGMGILSLEHNLISFDEKDDVAYMYSEVTYNVDGLTAPDYEVTLFATTRLVTSWTSGEPKLKDVHVFFDVFPNEIFADQVPG